MAAAHGVEYARAFNCRCVWDSARSEPCHVVHTRDANGRMLSRMTVQNLESAETNGG